MNDKYQVFNHKIGQHEPFDSLESALARRQELVTEYFNEIKGMFNIVREIAVGEDTTWVPIEKLPEEPPTI